MHFSVRGYAVTQYSPRPRIAGLTGFLALVAALTLSACGGGGGGGGGGNQTPTASFTVVPASGTAPLTVAVDASASSDPDGTISNYSWSFGDGSSASGVSTTHTFVNGGSYTITLTVRDNGGKTAKTSHPVSVIANLAPVAAFSVSTTKFTVPTAVTFDGSSSSDSDGSITNYAWDFGDGSSATGVVATHTYTTGGIFEVTLTVFDDRTATGAATRSVIASLPTPSPAVTVSGKVTYDRVPFNSTPGEGLDYGRISATPARGIVVEILNSSNGAFLAATTTDTQGNYSFAVPQNTSVFVRARAQLLAVDASGGQATWNVRVLDNTNSDALYVMDGSTFSTGTSNVARPAMNADSGWPGFGGTRYAGPRVAGPFAIADTIYKAVRFVVDQGGDASIALPDLNVYWSPSNRSSTEFNPATGNIQTTQFRSGATGGMYVLGNDGVDTDEYDEHVLTHEFQHFLQDATSRDDTLGGSHSFGEKLDMRVAFSEGYADAFSGMPLGNDPLYRDSSGAGQADDAFFNLESTSVAPKGWFNESTIAALAWDMFDTVNDANDNVAIAYSSIATVFRTTLRTGQPLTSIFPLVVALKAANPGSATAINTLVSNDGGMVAASMDPFGSTETNDANNADALPLYSSVVLNGSAVRVCGNRAEGIYNNVGNRRFLKFTLNSTVNATIRAVYTTNGSDTGGTPVAPDPDLVLYKGGWVATSESGTTNEENMVRTLDAGDYVIEVYEYSHIEDPSSGTARGRTCYNITLTG